MNDFNQDSGNKAPRGTSPWRRVAIAGAIAVVAMGVGAAAATSGVSTFYGPAMHVAMGSGGMGKGFAERRFDRMMTEIEASDEQAERLRDIFEAARDDLMPARADFHAFRDDLAALITAPRIDRAAAERMRAERVEAIDEASRRMTEAFIEAAEVLTPEQRVALVEKFEERRWQGRR
ncbi:MAG: Spy/CpxP family protein refolding chaperone [Rhizobiaceae bacterium]